MTDVRTSSETITRLKRFTAAGLLAAIGFLGTGHFAHAAAGEGTVAIRVAQSSGSDNASTATFASPSSAVTVTVGTKTYLRVDVAVGASHIAAAQNNVTMQVNLNLFPTNGWTTDTQAAVSDLDTVGEWFVTYTDTDSVTTNNSAISFAASASVNTGLLTIQADQQMDSTDIIKVFMVVNDNNYVRSAANFVVSVDDTGGDSLTPISAPATVATIAEPQLTSSITLGANSVVGAAGSTTLLLTPPAALAANDTVVWTMPANFAVPQGAITVASQTLAGGGTFTCTGVALTRVITCTTSGVITADVAGNIVLSGITSLYVADASNVADLTINSVTAGSGADIALDTTTAVTATTAGVMTSTNVAPATTIVGVSNTATVTFTTVNSIAADGKVKVTFGAGFVLTSITSTGMACSTLTGGTTATSVSGQTVTLTRTGGDVEAAGAQTCTIALVHNPTSAGTTGTYTIFTTDTSNNVIDRDAAVTADVMYSSDDSEDTATTGSAATYAIAFTAPAASAAYAAGDAVNIVWSTSAGTGTVGAVNLSYSTDGGLTFTTIVTATANDGSYTWDAPSISAQSVTIRAQATDLLTVLATATSNAFSIGTEVSGDDTSTPAEDVDTGATSTSLLPTGTYMKGESWATVYYIDGTTRRPFLDSQTFFTYASNFDAVIETSDDYLMNYTIGTPMVPKAGTVLVKIQSVNNVYVLGEDGELRWITSESIAQGLYGSNWADYVIDVPVTAWGHFTIGDDITSENDISVDADTMQTRDELNSMSV
ncbi:MAG: hypothetical protein AAB473_00215 [Patescibacteria group bacterium]